MLDFLRQGRAAVAATDLGGYESVREDDRQVLNALQAMGADLDQPRHVLHYLYVPGEEQASAAAGHLLGLGWEAEVREPLTGAPGWLVLSERSDYVLTPEHVASDRVLFDELAARFGGEYDGWEAAVA